MGRVDMFRSDVRNFSSSDLDTKRQDGGGTGVGCCITFDITASGDVQNSRISVVGHLNVIGALLLQTTYGIRYSNENIARQKCDDIGGLQPLSKSHHP